ncbi:anti-sigma factor [Nakamurella lactea]|uniref:anti-sigma factor n=1 Tax=Nakamurella lactea TaxID=459515 RepID=UPI000400515D|nr:anti-sigma factor [Nakamurella lactea]
MNAQLHVDTGARALDALLPAEAAAFDRHLDTCPSCATEYGEFTETVALLGSAVAVEPPPSLHVSLMRLIAITPQAPPPAAEPDPASSEPPGRAERVDRPRWYRRPPTLLAAVIIAVALIAGGVVVASQGTSGPPTAEVCVQRAADARVIAPDVGAGGSVRYAPSCHAAVVTTPKMPKLAAGNDYQLWVMAGDDAVSAGLVSASATPSSVVVPVAAADTAVGVSVEPSGGSRTPTTDPIWVVPLTG